MSVGPLTSGITPAAPNGGGGGSRRRSGLGNAGGRGGVHGAMRARRSVAGFTLIELMVVVVIMGILAGLVVPLALGAMQRGGRPRAAPRLAQAAPQLLALGRGGDPRALAVEASDVRVALRARPELDGVAIHTRYEAAFTGVFRVRSVDPGSDRVRLAFPFPPAMREARDVALRVRTDGGALVEPAGVRYSAEGVDWVGPLAPGATLEAVVSYTAQGRDAFVYDVAGGGRVDDVRCEVTLAGVERPVVPPSALQPTTVAPDRLVWSYRRLVTARRVVVELPPGPSPLGRVIALCRLAALAVLLFGAGFWYLAEGRAPGHLDDFRWGHFLLLALDYGLFFAVVAVLGYRGADGPALALAAPASLGLLTLHVARALDARFALTRALPLAVFTLVAVVAAVYLPDQRPVVLLAAGAAVVAYVTVTYRDWAAGREAWAAVRRAAAERAHREAKLREARASARKALDEAAVALDDAARALADAAPGADRERDEVARAVARLERAAGEGERAHAAAGDLAAVPDEAHAATVARWSVALPRHAAAVGAQSSALRAAVEALAARTTAAPRAGDGARHCAACGARRGADARYCAACGVARPAVRSCGRCGGRVELPTHLLKRGAEARPVHCPDCGDAMAA